MEENRVLEVPVHAQPEVGPMEFLRAADRLLGSTELARLAASVAGAATDWRERLRFPHRERWYGLLHADPYVQVWLLTWQQDSSTELHDHGDSAGAFYVVEGELEELRVGARHRLRQRTLGMGDVGSFSAGYVHDLANRRTEPAVSVHAYSPPLSSMTFYAPGGGGLVPTRTDRYDASGNLSLVRG
jgi:hypothetical protein